MYIVAERNFISPICTGELNTATEDTKDEQTQEKAGCTTFRKSEKKKMKVVK